MITRSSSGKRIYSWVFSSWKKETYQYVPIIEVLESQMQNGDILHEVLHDNVTGHDILADYIDGTLY